MRVDLMAIDPLIKRIDLGKGSRIKGWVSCYVHHIAINHGVHNNNQRTLNRRMTMEVCYWRCTRTICPATGDAQEGPVLLLEMRKKDLSCWNCH